MILSRAGEPESEPHGLVEAGAILFFLQEPELESELPWISAPPAVFKNFAKNNDFDIILQAKKQFFGFAVIEIFFRYTKINDL